MRILPFLLCLAAICVAPIACGGPQYGIGQGQPAYPERSVAATARLPLAITSVFVAKDPSKPTSTNATYGYVQLKNEGTTAIDFNQVSLSLVSANGTVTLNPAEIASLQTPLQADATRAIVEDDLAAFSQNLPYPTGQVVLVDDTFVVQAYIAWGTALPAPPYPTFTSSAISSNAIEDASANFVTLPTPSAPIAPATSVYINIGSTPPSTIAP